MAKVFNLVGVIGLLVSTWLIVRTNVDLSVGVIIFGLSGACLMYNEEKNDSEEKEV